MVMLIGESLMVKETHCWKNTVVNNTHWENIGSK